MPRRARKTVPSFAAKRRVRALQAIGWSVTHLCRKAGVGPNYFEFIYYDRRIPLRKHAEIAQLYERLRGTTGPSEHSIIVGRNRGWAPPWAWNNIDDPQETIEYLS